MAWDGTVGKIQAVTPLAPVKGAESQEDAPSSRRAVDKNGGVGSVSPSLGLSGAAKVLDQVFRLFPGTTGLLLNNGVPLFSEAPTGAVLDPDLIRHFQDAVRCSGLFYESHLAAWVAGNQDAFERLMRAPQMHQNPEGERASADDLLSQLFHKADILDAPPMETVQQSDEDKIGYLQQESVWGIVRQQMDVVATGQLAVRFQLWPEQWVDLEVQRESGGDGDRAEIKEEVWTANIETRIEPLGCIQARLQLSGTELSVSIAVHDNARAILASRVSDLEDTLSMVGLKVSMIFGELASEQLSGK